MTGFSAVLRIALVLLASGVSAGAQEPEAPSAASDAPAAPKPKPRPKPKPKPAPKADTGTTTPSEPASKPANGPVTDQTGKTGSDIPASPEDPAAPLTSRTAQVAPAVACDPGKSVFYDGPGGFSFWVTRTGGVTIENPLRPLTPDTTRVLQLVISGKLATAYGPDLGTLRRGGSPGILEAQLGGAIRWDATLGTLPDTLGIVTDSGAPLADMRFKECGDAPAAKALPVAKKKGEKAAQAGKTDGPAAAKPEKPKPAQGAPATSGSSARPVQPRAIPQGAISE